MVTLLNRPYANTIDGCSGEENITEMWRDHFEQYWLSLLMMVVLRCCFMID